MPSRKHAPARRPCPVVLLTDFGPGSPYAGQMRLALEQTAPGTPVLDLAHDLPAHGVAAAALTLCGSQGLLPRPGVVCVVVDPDVGSRRRILAAEFRGGLVVLAPDNGILGLPWTGDPLRRLHSVTNRALFREEVSPVFHGRDIFAPVAARLARGLPLREVGPALPLAPALRPPWPSVEPGPPFRGVRVIYADRFGNLVTNLPAAALPARARPIVRCRGRVLPFVTHYAAVPRGRPLALIGSFGFLELAARDASAAKVLGARPGTAVRVELR